MGTFDCLYHLLLPPSTLALTFWLGTHEPHWLSHTTVPLFLSRRRISRLINLPRARGPWALDSGGFSELQLFGRWETTAKQYVGEVRLWQREIGNLQFAAIQDFMCEPFMLAKTGLSLRVHQRRTVFSYLQLRWLAPDLPWLPVLQGWTMSDYLTHVGDYAAVGIDLTELPLVGLGSVCRRQGTDEAAELVRTLASLGIRLHGFGMKTSGLRKIGAVLVSADSMAWSFRARKIPPLPGCTHRSCSNCRRFALRWRRRLLRGPGGPLGKSFPSRKRKERANMVLSQLGPESP